MFKTLSNWECFLLFNLNYNVEKLLYFLFH